MDGDVIGTPAYMSPEQSRGDIGAMGPASDVYSLGAILYHLITGRPPFKAKSTLETLLEVIRDVPPPPRSISRR